MFNQKLSNTKMRKLFDWAMTSALLIILPMTSCVTGINDVDEIDEEPHPDAKIQDADQHSEWRLVQPSRTAVEQS